MNIINFLQSYKLPKLVKILCIKQLRSSLLAPFIYMLQINWCILCSLCRTRSEKEIRSITALLALFGFILGFLLTLVGLKYPSSGATLFHKHHAIMLGLMIDLVTFTTVLVAAMLPITNRNCFHFFQKVCLFFGALACNLLIFILVPILGWVFFTLGVSILVYLLYGSYRMIFKFCQENLKSISNWFRQKFQYQSSSQSSSQASNGSPMLTPNVTEKQMTELESVWVKICLNFLSQSKAQRIGAEHVLIIYRCRIRWVLWHVFYNFLKG